MSDNIQLFGDKAITRTDGFDFNVSWVPFIDLDSGRVGYRVSKLDENGISAEQTYIYFNPSSDGDEGAPDVFVYEGTANDPALDSPLHFYCPHFEEVSA